MDGVWEQGMSERKDNVINLSYSKVQVAKIKEMHSTEEDPLNPVQDMFMMELPRILKMIEKGVPSITINFINTDLKKVEK